VIDAATYGRQPAPGISMGPIAHVVPEDRGAEWVCLLFWQAPTPYAPTAGVAGPALKVYANEGRWVVDCPDCSGAQLACRTDPRFMCVYCGNASVGGKWRPVSWPRSADLIEIELSARPVEHQHWLPGDTLRQLRAENAAHGLVSA